MVWYVGLGAECTPGAARPGRRTTSRGSRGGRCSRGRAQALAALWAVPYEHPIASATRWRSRPGSSRKQRVAARLLPGRAALTGTRSRCCARRGPLRPRSSPDRLPRPPISGTAIPSSRRTERTMHPLTPSSSATSAIARTAECLGPDGSTSRRLGPDLEVDVIDPGLGEQPVNEDRKNFALPRRRWREDRLATQVLRRFADRLRPGQLV